MDPLDAILTELKTEYQQKKNPSTTPKTSHQDPKSVASGHEDILIQQLKAEARQGYKPASSPPKSVVSPPQRSPQEDILIQQLKSESQEKEILRQQQQEEEQRRKEENKRKALKLKAKEWLKKLNPNSEEGLWFEEFSYGYNSREEAAMDYLDALRETRFLT